MLSIYYCSRQQPDYSLTKVAAVAVVNSYLGITAAETSLHVKDSVYIMPIGNWLPVRLKFNDVVS